jgi:hypothetical protein
METDEQLRARMQEKAKPRFGRMSKDYGELGELRRQKKGPHKEVLYIWIAGNLAATYANGVQPTGPVLRSINNCTNDQLTEAIKLAGRMCANHNQTNMEQALDLMYLELGKRTKCET